MGKRSSKDGENNYRNPQTGFWYFLNVHTGVADFGFWGDIYGTCFIPCWRSLPTTSSFFKSIESLYMRHMKKLNGGDE